MYVIAATGLSGEIGKLFLNSVSKNIEIIDLYHKTPISHPQVIAHIKTNLENIKLLRSTLDSVGTSFKPQFLIHLAAITHLDRCELDKEKGKESLSWIVNVEATQIIAQHCFKYNVHLIYLSTECVFDGNKLQYLESDRTNPKSWYGTTKAAAEQVIINSGANASILRAVIAYSPQGKHTIWQKITDSALQNTLLKMANDHYMTPTYVGDLILAIRQVIRHKYTGIFHITPNAAITPFDFAQKIFSHYNYNSGLLKSNNLQTILGLERAKLRLKHACLDSTQTNSILNIPFRLVDEVLKTV